MLQQFSLGEDKGESIKDERSGEGAEEDAWIFHWEQSRGNSVREFPSCGRRIAARRAVRGENVRGDADGDTDRPALQKERLP